MYYFTMKLPIGRSDFKSLREEELYYIDKSLLIKEIIEDNGDIILLPRPRRFGKTLNLSMLWCFFGNSEYRKLFKGLKIYDEELFQAYQGRYPVVFLTFKDLKDSDFDSSVKKIEYLISDEFRRCKYLLDNLTDDEDREMYRRILKREAERTDYENALPLLTRLLNERHNQKVVLLIDEYDTPIHTAFSEVYYDEMIKFLKNILSPALKDNPYIFKAMLTGILRVARESILSGLNNLVVYSVLREEYSTMFGFRDSEVKEMLRDFDMEDQILGLLVNLTTHHVRSNRESGFGRDDIMIIPRDKRDKGIVMELKTIDDFEGEDKEIALNRALKQIEEKRYEVELRDQGVKDIIILGVTFDGKRVWVMENIS